MKYIKVYGEKWSKGFNFGSVYMKHYFLTPLQYKWDTPVVN